MATSKIVVTITVSVKQWANLPVLLCVLTGVKVPSLFLAVNKVVRIEQR